MAHPDDEIIFGWPVFQATHLKRSLLTCSSDLNNSAKPSHFACRKEVLFEVCASFDVPARCWDYNSKFSAEAEAVGKMPRQLEQVVEATDPDYIFTHNPHGEYGHPDHKFLFKTFFNLALRPLIITDMMAEEMEPEYYSRPLGKCALRREVLHFCYQRYREKSVWTWSQRLEEIPHSCSLYLVIPHSGGASS